MLESTWQARAMLGPGRWTQVLRIEQTRPGSAPVKVVHALVFELEGRLWYYAADHGTESLSTRRGRLAEDKADLGPLLSNIDPGFGRYEILKEEPPTGAVRRSGEPLSQGCFIDCVAYLQTMIAAGRIPDDARLLAYYYDLAAAGRRGHTVLYFAREGRRFFYDPDRSLAPSPIPDHVRLEALAIAQVTVPGNGYAPPVRAVFLPLQLPSLPGSGLTSREIAVGGTAAHTHESAAPVLMN